MNDRLIGHRCLSHIGTDLLLVFSWTAGFLSGLLFSFQLYDLSLFTSSQEIIVFNSLHIVVLLFPLVFSYLAMSWPVVFLLFSFVKAFSLAYSSGYLLISFGFAGWLLRLLFLFSDILFQPFLFWFWLKHINGNKDGIKKHVAICAVAAILIFLLDLLFVSPLLNALILG